MKTYTFNTNEFKNNNNIIIDTFRTEAHYDYSKMLDDIIAADVIKKNTYLFDTTPSINISSNLKDETTEFIKAAKFLATYKEPKKENKLKFIIGKTYKLIDGTPIIFYDDEIQIGFDVFKYSDFAMSTFLEHLKPSTKKIIIDIYTKSNNININIAA